MLRVLLLLVCCLVLCPRPAEVAYAATPADRYLVNSAADTVKDTRTGLTWKLSVSSTSSNLSGAVAYCAQLQNGWRLPSLKELVTLVDPTRFNPAIDPAFGSAPLGSFWTSSVKLESGASEQWIVRFVDGRTTWNPFNRATTYPEGEPCCFARCVR
jgi:hypothetical protein